MLQYKIDLYPGVSIWEFLNSPILNRGLLENKIYLKSFLFCIVSFFTKTFDLDIIDSLLIQEYLPML